MGFCSVSVAVRAALSFVLVILLFHFFNNAFPSSPYRYKSTETPPMARSIPASELLSRPPTARPGVIPKTFHQSWQSLELPAKYQAWSLSCRRNHPDWEWVVWTDEDNLRLVQMHFPWLEQIYRDLPAEIYRADLSRYLYMYIYGGVYADLDTECLLPTEELQQTYGPLFDRPPSYMPDTAIFARMGNDPDFEHSIPNAWMASTPGHPFFLVMVRTVMQIFQQAKDDGDSSVLPESLTGPVALREAIARYERDKVLHGSHLGNDVAELARGYPFAADSSENHRVLLLPSHLVYPYSWGQDGEDVRDLCWVLRDAYDPDQCKKRLGVGLKRSISITYWSHTHSPTGHSEENMQHIN